MRTFALVMASAAFATTAYAQSHLVLEGFADADRRAALESVFRTVYEPGVQARVLVEPKSGAQYAVGLKESNGRYTIVAQLASKRLSTEAGAKKAIVLGCSMEIPAKVGAHVAQVWQAMLARTGPTRSLKTVGDNYRFSMAYNGEQLAGQAFSPAPDSAPGQLVEMVHTMRALCTTKDTSLLAQLRHETSELSHTLSSPSGI